MNPTDPDLFSGLVLFIVLLMIGCLALSLTRNHRNALGFQVRLFLCALVVRFMAAVAIYQFGLVQMLKDEDASGWLMGVSLQQTWVQQGIDLFSLPEALMPAFQGNHRGYYYMLGAFFFVTDTPARLPAAALNCFFGALTVIFAYRTARALFSPWVAVRVGWMACFFPALIIWSAQTLKEPVVIFLEAVALYSCVRLKASGFTLRHVLICGIVIVLLIPFRFYAAYVVGGTVMLALAFPNADWRKMRVGAALVIAALVIPIVGATGALVQREARLEQYDLKRIEKFRRDVARGTGSGVRSQYNLRTPGGFVMGTAVGAAHLMLAPFPWQLVAGSRRMILTLPDLVIWWFLFFIGVLPGLWHVIRTRFNDIQPLLFFIFSLGLLYSLTFGNIGLVYRQRAQLLPWLLILAAVGLEQWVLRYRAKRGGHSGTMPIGTTPEAGLRWGYAKRPISY